MHFPSWLEQTTRKLIKRHIHEEYLIVTTELHEYPEKEQRFNEYELYWMSRPPGIDQSNLIFEFFEKYLAFLEKDFPKGVKIID